MLEQCGMVRGDIMKIDWESVTHIFQIPLRWFREIDRRSRIIPDGNIINADVNNAEGTVLSIDKDALDIPSTETGTTTDGSDSPAVLDATGGTWSWSAGGSGGLMLDCYCKIAPQTSTSNYTVFQRCRLTFSKDGLLTTGQLLSDRIRVQARNA